MTKLELHSETNSEKVKSDKESQIKTIIIFLYCFAFINPHIDILVYLILTEYVSEYIKKKPTVFISVIYDANFTDFFYSHLLSNTRKQLFVMS